MRHYHTDPSASYHAKSVLEDQLNDPMSWERAVFLRLDSLMEGKRSVMVENNILKGEMRFSNQYLVRRCRLTYQLDPALKALAFQLLEPF